MKGRRRLGIFVAAAILGISAGSAARSDDDELRAALQSRYAEMKTAMAAHDVSAIAAMLAPDFISIDVAGRSESADQLIAEVDALKPDPNKVSETTLLSVVAGSGAVMVEQRYDMKTIRITADGTQHKIELLALSTDLWVKPADVWLLKKSVTNELSYFKDGQLVGHQQQKP